MYIPGHFREDDRTRLEKLIGDYAFGLLVTTEQGVPFASHLPLMFDATQGENGTVSGHMARSNPQWRHFESNSSVLAVFQGPHAYVSPSWYAAPGVPTWNYAVVHAYGTPRLLEDRAAVRAIVERLTAINEARFTPPWQPNLDDERTARMLDMIVGFKIEVTDLQGKYKLSQNRSAEDQGLVIERLSKSASQVDAAVGDLMAGNRRRGS